MDVDAQQAPAVRPGAGEGNRGIDEARDRHACFARDPEQAARAAVGRSVAGTASCSACGRSAQALPDVREVQEREIGVRAPGRGPHQERALVELVPEAIVDVERVDARSALRRFAHQDRVAIEQCIAGARLPHDAVDGHQHGRRR